MYNMLYIHVYILYIYIYRERDVYMYIYIYTYINVISIYIYIYMHIHTYIQTYMYTYIAGAPVPRGWRAKGSAAKGVFSALPLRTTFSFLRKSWIVNSCYANWVYAKTGNTKSRWRADAFGYPFHLTRFSSHISGPLSAKPLRATE